MTVHWRYNFGTAAKIFLDVLAILFRAAVADEAVSEGPDAGEKTDDVHNNKRFDSVTGLFAYFEGLK